MGVQVTASKDVGSMLGTHECYLMCQECGNDNEGFLTVLGSPEYVLGAITVDFLQGKQKECWHKRERAQYWNKSFL